MKHNIFIDGTNLAWQVYYSAKNTSKTFSNHTPETANEIIYGFLNVLSPILNPKKKGSITKSNEDLNIIVALDKGISWRYNIYPDYKNGTQPAKDSPSTTRFGAQIERLPHQLNKFGITTIAVNELEADDLIALNVTNNSDKNTIISKDKDLIGLVSDTISFYEQAKKEVINQDNFNTSIEALFKKSHHVNQNNWYLFRALVGDPSDNIQGVKGFGIPYASNVLETLEANNIKITSKTSPDEITSIIASTTSKLPKNLQLLLNEDGLESLKVSYILGNSNFTPENLKQKALECNLETEKPTLKDVENTLKELNFNHFISQIPKGWASPFIDSKAKQIELDM